MSNPFLGKSLTQLRDGAPSLSNAELDALAACVCDGEWLQFSPTIGGKMIWNVWVSTKYGGYILFPAHFHYTTDWREAGRLLVKYKIDTLWIEDHKDDGDVWAAVGPSPQYSVNTSLHRAITEAAVAAELTKRIENATAKAK